MTADADLLEQYLTLDTVWGGIMTEVASIRGVAGPVIDGVCRDVSASLARGYPLFSRGRFMRTGKDRCVWSRSAPPFPAAPFPRAG